MSNKNNNTKMELFIRFNVSLFINHVIYIFFLIRKLALR